MVWKDIVNPWEFPSNISRIFHKRLVPNLAWDDQWRIFVKLSPWPTGLFCRFFSSYAACLVPVRNLFLAYLACCSFPPPAINTRLFSQVSLPTLSADALKLFLPITTSVIFCAAYSNKWAPTSLAGGTTYLRKNWIAVLPNCCASAPNALPRCRPKPPKSGVSTCLTATIL